VILLPGMAIRSFRCGDEIYELGADFPNSKDYVVGKIDFLPATDTRSVTSEEWIADEEQDEKVRVNGKATETLAVTNREVEDQCIRNPEQYLVIRMPRDLYTFYVDARKHLVDEKHGDLSDLQYHKLAELLAAYEKRKISTLLVRHIFSERRMVQYYDEAQSTEHVMRLLLADLAQEVEAAETERPRAEA
jgi:hypothetical protein